MDKNIVLNILIYLICLSSVAARHRGGFFNFSRRIHIDSKSIGRGLLKGLHVAEKIAASGALGPEFKAAAIVAETAETAVRGIIKHESAKQIAEESAMTAAGALVGGGMKEKLLRMVAKKIGISVPPPTGSEDTNFSSDLMNKVKGKLAEHGINDPTAHIKEMMTEHIKENMAEFMPGHAIENHDEDQRNYGKMSNNVTATANTNFSQSSINNIDSSQSPSPSSIKSIDFDSDAPNLMKAPDNDYFPFLSPYVFDPQNPSFLQPVTLASMQYYQNPYMYSQYPSMNSQYPNIYRQYPSMNSQYPNMNSQYPNMNSQYPNICDQNYKNII